MHRGGVQLRWTVRTGGTSCDVVVEVPPGARWGDVVGPLTACARAAPARPPAWVAGVPVGDDDRVGRGRLRSGAQVDLGAPVTGRGLPGGLQLRVVGGPDAGHVVALRPGTTRLGRAPGCEVRLADPALSRTHVVLSVGSSGVAVADAGSTSGARVGDRVLGDVPLPWAPGEHLRAGRSSLVLAEPDLVGAAVRDPAPGEPDDGLVRLARPPRLLDPPPDVVVDLPPDPPEPRTVRVPWVAVALPAVLGLVLAAVLGPVYLLFVLLAPVTALGSWATDRSGSRREAAAARATSGERLAAASRRLHEAADADGRRRHAQAPDLARLLLAARGPGDVLWQRRPGDPDALHVRLGTGELPARVTVRPASGAPTAAPALRTPLLPGVPVVVPLREAGVLGLAGRADDVRAVMRAVAASAAALHSPRDLLVVVLPRPDAAASWHWASWLPHTDGAALGRHGSRTVAGDARQAAALVAELRTLVRRRAGQARAGGAGRRPPLPEVVVVCDGARALRVLPGFAEVLADGPAAGVYVVAADADPQRLPEEAGAVLVLHGPGDATLQVAGQRTRVRAEGVGPAWVEELARALAPLRDDEGRVEGGASLPGDVALDEVDPLPGRGGDVAHEAAALRRRWAAPPSTRAVLGVGLDGPEVVDLAVDGPHALVAGTTGAGKSELLRTLVASLARGSPPDRLSLVLVDYKGGAAFGPLADLPHVAGVVTDLDGAGTRRVLRSLDAELDARKTYLARVGVDDLRDAPAGAPPRLVVVVDELAALVADVPEFVDDLVAVAAQGRALGVHLVLATQRPRGAVSADVRANTALRVCLAVAETEESVDVIGVGDAALLGRLPGRGFVSRAGGSAVPFQAARVVASGGGSTGDGVTVRRAQEVLAAVGAQDGATRRGLARLVAAARLAAQQEGLRAARAPWLPELPDRLDLGAARAEVLPEGPPPEAALPEAALPEAALPQDLLLAGLVDDPGAQRRLPLGLDLGAHGNVLVAGGPRSGRTTALRAVAAAVALRDPASTHLLCVDAGGGLSGLAVLPHCGAVVRVDDAGRVDRLLAALRSEVGRRRDRLAALGVTRDGARRSARAGGEPWPDVLLLVDGVEALLAAVEHVDGGRLAEALLDLCRDGPGVGVHVVLAGGRSALSGRLASLCDVRWVLRLPDPADLALVGLVGRDVPDRMPPGRAVVGEPPLLAQLAEPSPDPALWCPPHQPGVPASGPGAPLRVDPLPDLVTDLPALPARAGPLAVRVGLGGDRLAPVDVDLADVGAGFLVPGPPRSGRSSLLLAVAVQLAERAPDVTLAVVAPRPSPLRRAAGLPGVLLVRGPADAAALADLAVAGRPTATLVDDAELVLDGPLSGALAALGERVTAGEGALVLAGASGALETSFAPAVVAARRAGCGLALRPSGPLAADALGVRLAAGLRGGPAGRGVLVVRGAVTQVQVALPPRLRALDGTEPVRPVPVPADG